MDVDKNGWGWEVKEVAKDELLMVYEVFNGKETLG